MLSGLSIGPFDLFIYKYRHPPIIRGVEYILWLIAHSNLRAKIFVFITLVSEYTVWNTSTLGSSQCNEPRASHQCCRCELILGKIITVGDVLYILHLCSSLMILMLLFSGRAYFVGVLMLKDIHSDKLAFCNNQRIFPAASQNRYISWYRWTIIHASLSHGPVIVTIKQ